MVKTDIGKFKGMGGAPPRFAPRPQMVSRTGTFSSFTDDNDTSYNISRASNSGSTSTWDTHHVLIHSIRFENTNDDNLAVIYFYQNDDSTNANAIAGTNHMFYLLAAGSNQDRASNTLQVDFPIPLCVKNGCRITANRGGPIVNINYTVLNTADADDYNNVLRYKYLTGASLNSTTATAIHPHFGADTAHDLEIWGGVVYNKSTSNDDYNSGWITSTGESDVEKARLTANEQKSDDDDASAAFTGTYRPMFWPYPVICKQGAKIDMDDSDTYSTWFYRLRKSDGAPTIGWV